MPILPQIIAFHPELTALRRDIHAHPELGFEETRTSDLVARKLAEFGIELTREIGRTGVVGSLRVGTGKGSIGLRADMDALPMEENNTFPHRSRHPGCMHACGHDGHTVMLLGAARYLAETRKFNGTVHFIFQPAEEGRGGAQAMIDDGLFDRFPVDAVYGVHNSPGYPVGVFSAKSGPTMAGSSYFDIEISGRGGHSARPEVSIDPVVVAAHVITSLQTVISRTVSPLDMGVVSATMINGGTAYNVIPDNVTIAGNIRTFRKEVRDQIEASMVRIVEGAGHQFGAQARISFRHSYPPLVNHERETLMAVEAAAEVVGDDKIIRNGKPRMTSEDFAFMLQRRPGAFLFLGNGEGEGSCDVHNPNYDFNDAILPIGASFFARLVERTLR